MFVKIYFVLYLFWDKTVQKFVRENLMFYMVEKKKPWKNLYTVKLECRDCYTGLYPSSI